MSIIKFLGIPFEEWRGQGLDDKIQEAGMKLYEAGLPSTASNIQEVLNQQGEHYTLRQSEQNNTILVQRPFGGCGGVCDVCNARSCCYDAGHSGSHCCRECD